MRRLSHDEIFMGQALIAAGGSTCPRRAVGCVLVDKHNYVIGVGRNGVPKGLHHCLNDPCPGAHLPSGQGLDACLATHAEMNALLQCKDVQAIKTCYTTTAPCIHCIKLLMNTSCRQITFLHGYHTDTHVSDLWGQSTLVGSQKGWYQMTRTPFLIKLEDLVTVTRINGR